MTFPLDTSGYVWMPLGAKSISKTRWSDLTPFAQGYIDALFGAEVETGEQRWIAPLREVRRFSDLAPETLARIMEDCARWRSEYRGSTRETSASRTDMGHEFWRIRQEGTRSTFPPLTPYLADDGMVYLKEAAA